MDPLSLILLFFAYLFGSMFGFMWDNAEDLHRQARRDLAAGEDEEAEEEDDSDPAPRPPQRGRPSSKASHLRIVKEETFSLDSVGSESDDPFVLKDEE